MNDVFAQGGHRARLALVFPTFPPVINGIGDYTARLAAALTSRYDVAVWTAQEMFDTVDDVAVEHIFSTKRPRGVCALLDAVAQQQPDVIVLQFEQFAYGSFGFNPHLPMTMRKIKRQYPGTRLVLMIHEAFVPFRRMKFVVMNTWQRWQFWMSCRQADAVCFSTSAWIPRFQKWFPGKPIHHLPVGSNIDRIAVDRATARASLGLSDDTVVLGLFGIKHPDRLFGMVRGAYEGLTRLHEKIVLLYIGPHGPGIRSAYFEDIRMIDAGPQPSDALSPFFAAMDLYLAPFKKGVSTKRGSFMAGLQHEVATLSTRGVDTDQVLIDENGSSLVLTSEDETAFAEAARDLVDRDSLREMLGTNAGRLFAREFSWEAIARRLGEILTGLDPALSGSAPSPRAASIVSDTASRDSIQ